MIDLSLLDREDLMNLFEGFTTDFLRVPLQRPIKSINKYIPAGFRISKIPRHMLIRMYCDAVIGNEPSICNYVINEISKCFDDAGITEYLASKSVTFVQDQATSLAELSSVLWENGMTIPAYIILLLSGIECSHEIKTVSMSLNKAHYTAIERAKEYGEKLGQQDASAVLQSVQDTAEKNEKKLKKRIATLEEQSVRDKKLIEELSDQSNKLEAQLEHSDELVRRLQEWVENYKKQIAVLTNDNEKYQRKVDLLNNAMSDYDTQLEELGILRDTVGALRTELESSKEREYSDAVLQRLCSDVLDELQSPSLGSREILELAKKRFSSSDSVATAWQAISDFSETHIKVLIDSISNSDIYTTILDDVEEIEDGILIKFAVIKSLKSIIYSKLEATESERTIADKFSRNVE